jgi:hypothetical protein
MRRPLDPLPSRPNPTDPGDAADLSTPQGVEACLQSDARLTRRDARVDQPLPPTNKPARRWDSTNNRSSKTVDNSRGSQWDESQCQAAPRK